MFADAAPCPCRSGLIVSECSCKERQFVPLPASTIPPLPTTGLKVKGCYAAEVCDCKPPLTAEHPISKGVLNVLSGGRSIIGVSNHPWQKKSNRVQQFGISALTKKVLCERHNNALSSLDAVGAHLIEAMSDAMSHLVSGASGDFHCLFNGFDIERWMLKVLCSIHCDKRVPGSALLEPWRVPKSWLSILFGRHTFQPRCGLCRTRRPTTRRPLAGTSIYVQPVYARLWPTPGSLPLIDLGAAKTVAGVEISVLNLQLTLIMYPAVNRPEIYRPRMFRFHDPETGRASYLHLGWDETPPTFQGRMASRDEHGFSEKDTRAAVLRGARLKAQRKRRFP
jgi:hypothetical protein